MNPETTPIILPPSDPLVPIGEPEAPTIPEPGPLALVLLGLALLQRLRRLRP